MKKMIALILSLAMSLCPCAGGETTNTSEPSETQQDTTNGATAEEIACAEILCGTWFGWLEDPVTYKDTYNELIFTEDGKLTFGDQQLTWSLASAKNDAYCVVAGEYTFFLERNEKGNYVIYLNDRDHLFYNITDFNIINLTVDNWKDYLELANVHEFVTDENGKTILTISQYLLLKDEYTDMFILPDYSFQYRVDLSLSPYVINFDTKTIDMGEMSPGGDNIGARTHEIVEIEGKSVIGSLLDYSRYTTEEVTAVLMTEMHMIRMQGKLCIAKE